MYTKSAVSESSIALGRLNLTFLPLGLYETWHNFSKLSDDRRISRETDGYNENCLGVRFASCIIKALRLARIEHCSGTVVTPFIPSELGTHVYCVDGYKTLPRIFQFLPRDLVMVFSQSKKKNGVKSSLNFGCETDGNNEICLGVHFALCIIKSSTTRSH